MRPLLDLPCPSRLTLVHLPLFLDSCILNFYVYFLFFRFCNAGSRETRWLMTCTRIRIRTCSLMMISLSQEVLHFPCSVGRDRHPRLRSSFRSSVSTFLQLSIFNFIRYDIFFSSHFCPLLLFCFKQNNQFPIAFHLSHRILIFFASITSNFISPQLTPFLSLQKLSSFL